MEHVRTTGCAGTQAHDNGRSADGFATDECVARMLVHADESAGGPIMPEPKSQSVVSTALETEARTSVDDSVTETPTPTDTEAQKRPMGAQGAFQLLALDGAIDAESSGLVPIPGVLRSATAVLSQILSGDDAEERSCQTKTLHVVNVAGVFMVSLNAILIFLELEKQGAEIAAELGIAPDVTGWDSLEVGFHIADHVFNAFYLTELIIKLVIMRSAYFKDAMNIIDAVVALLNSVDLIILNGSSSSLVLARLARLVKVSKLMRLSRILRTSSEMCALVHTLYHSLKSLVAAAVLLMIIVFITGLAMAQFVSMFLMDECAPNVPLCDWAYQHYGSGSRASWTMFKVTLSGGWPTWASDLVESVNWFYIFFWVMYIIVVWFGVLRVITALFLKQTMEVAAADQEMIAKEKLKQKAKHAAAMRRFFAASDVDGNGMINHAEFKAALLDKDAAQWLHGMGVEHTEIDALFQMLDNGDGNISFDELLANAARLGGMARASDQVAIICNQKNMLRAIEKLTCGLDNHDANTVKRRISHAART